MQVSTIINDVAKELGDTAFTTWTRAHLIGLLNQAVRQVLLVRPDANSSTESIPLTAGSLQALPAGALRLLRVIRNMGTDGLTPGRVIRFVDQPTLDAFDPDWHSATPSAVIKSYTYDEKAPDVFYVNPPANGLTQIEVVVSRLPAVLDPAMDDPTFNDANTVTNLKDIYANTLMDWVLYKAYSYESSAVNSAQMANAHMNSFYNSLGVKAKTDAAISPMVTNDQR